MLLIFFRMFCYHCRAPNTKVTIKWNGTMATVIQKCSHCGQQITWRSQPFIHGRYPAENLMMSFGILLSGVNISQVFLMFRHTGLSAISPRSYFLHQLKFLFPSVFMHWYKYRTALIEKTKTQKEFSVVRRWQV